MSYIARLQASREAPVAEPSKGSKGASDPFAGAETARFRGLPPHLAEGLAQLQSRSPPQITRPEIWPALVADAVRLGRDGWAVQALGSGWHPLDLWGCSPERGGNPDHDGLAVWLDSRRVLLIDDATCIVEAGQDARSVFYRPSVAAGGVFLWDMGRVS